MLTKPFGGPIDGRTVGDAIGVRRRHPRDECAVCCISAGERVVLELLGGGLAHHQGGVLITVIAGMYLHGVALLDAVKPRGVLAGVR